MDQDDKELVRRLMAKATAMPEDATVAAASGQSQSLSALGYARAARQLRAAAHKIAVIAEAVGMVADSGTKGPRNPRKSRT
jgi:hypothetical protein